jgi:hypothetical protein
MLTLKTVLNFGCSGKQLEIFTQIFTKKKVIFLGTHITDLTIYVTKFIIT